MGVNKIEIEKQKFERFGKEKFNNQGCLMKIIKYDNATNVTIEFQDKFKTIIQTTYDSFLSGSVRNPYCPSVYGVGIVGNKYKTSENFKHSKEYTTWTDMLARCFNNKNNDKNKNKTYKDVTCCDEWLLFENFYEWLHNQENFDKWLKGKFWAIDKDIIIKGNKIYSPETCCLVPSNVNSLFVKKDINRGDLPIGVTKNNKGFQAKCRNPFTNKTKSLGTYLTLEQSFQKYKLYKEYIIKQVAQIEYDNGNITKRCCEAMMKYEVEITD